MASKITISIPEPCHENWQAMTVVEKGRFCDSCQKKVFDFTTASDRQIIETFNKNGNLCGRFNNSQLNRELIQPKEKNTIWLATTATIISFLGFGSQEIIAQEKTATEQIAKGELLGKVAPAKENEERKITGTVSDAKGPLPGANVQRKGKTIVVQTDLDGKFSIKANENEVLVFSFIGMEDLQLTIDKLSDYNIVLKESAVGNSEVMVTGGYAIGKRRTFFGRIFHRIGNWFR